MHHPLAATFLLQLSTGQCDRLGQEAGSQSISPSQGTVTTSTVARHAPKGERLQAGHTQNPDRGVLWGVPFLPHSSPSLGDDSHPLPPQDGDVIWRDWLQGFLHPPELAGIKPMPGLSHPLNPHVYSLSSTQTLATSTTNMKTRAKTGPVCPALRIAPNA